MMDRIYHYYMDKEGRIWHEGTEMNDPRFALLIQKNLQSTPEGLLAKCQGEKCFFQVEDVPYVVQDVALVKDEEGSLEQVDLIFPGGYMERLNPSTLFVSKENVLYCSVREGAFNARFSRNSYFRLIPFLVEDPEQHTYHLKMGGKRFAIGQPAALAS